MNLSRCSPARCRVLTVRKKQQHLAAFYQFYTLSDYVNITDKKSFQFYLCGRIINCLRRLEKISSKLLPFCGYRVFLPICSLPVISFFTVNFTVILNFCFVFHFEFECLHNFGHFLSSDFVIKFCSYDFALLFYFILFCL